MKCTICADKARKKIDAALVKEGATIRGIARQFGVSDDALTRHVKNGHVIARIAKAQAAQDIVEADTLLQEIQEIQGHQKTIFKEARKRKAKDENNKDVPYPDNKLALESLRDQIKIIDVKGRVLGSFIKDKPTEPIAPIREIPDEEVERRAREIFAKRSK
jgi:transposase-like protein